MKKDDLLPLLKTYAQIYGNASMQKETIDLWAKKFADTPTEKVTAAFEQLIAGREHKFGIKMVFDTIAYMWPPESAHVAVERDWGDVKSTVKLADWEKRIELGKVMRALIAENMRCKKKGETHDWMPKYAQKFVEVWGEGEAGKQASSLSYLLWIIF